MTEINGVRIPSMPGSCYHAIICALAEVKDRFCSWYKVVERTEHFMRMYGGEEAWAKFKNKSEVKTYECRIKDNAHTLTRSGKDCYGYRLHERGMAIYFFKDGAILFTGGVFTKKGSSYAVKFPDGKGLQHRYRGTTMSFKEYKNFLEHNYITASGELRDADSIRNVRARIALDKKEENKKRVKVSIVLDDRYNQDTAFRLRSFGLIVAESEDNELSGTLPADQLDNIMEDDDVVDVVVA